MNYDSQTVAGTFNQSVTRDQKAREYIASGAFYEGLRKAAQKEVVNGGRSLAGFWPSEFKIKKQDAALIQPIFEKVKQEFPELDHFRVMGHGEILLDTKKNTFLRRLASNRCANPGF